jgi:hypothetical protein
MFKFLKTGVLTQLLTKQGIRDFDAALDFVRHLPYKRISNPTDLSLTISEHCGTCSSKHAFLKALAMEQDRDEVQLVLAMYKMNAKNTPGIGSAISEAGLEYIPEAHCFLRINEQVLDCTNPEANVQRIEKDILEERAILPNQVGTWKVNYHKDFIENWLLGQTNLRYSPEAIWEIREKCILALSIR